MGTNTLSTSGIATDSPVEAAHVTQFFTSLDGDYVPRTSGAPADQGGNLGTASFRWASARVDNLLIDGNTISSLSGGVTVTPLAGQVITLDTSTTIDGGVITNTGQLNIDNLRLDGNTISSTDTDGNISLVPNGNGDVIVNTTDLVVDTSASRVGVGTATPARKSHVEEDTALTATVNYNQRLTHTTSGTVAANFGVGVEFEAETTAGNEILGTVEVIATDVGSGTEDGELVIKLMEGGAAAAERARLGADGLLTVTGNAKQKVNADDVSNPPTDAELDAIFGTPATVGDGFNAYIDDAGGGANFYHVVASGTNWWVFTGTVAA